MPFAGVLRASGRREGKERSGTSFGITNAVEGSRMALLRLLSLSYFFLRCTYRIGKQAMLQPPFPQLSTLCIYKRNLLEARVVITTYNQHDRGCDRRDGWVGLSRPKRLRASLWVGLAISTRAEWRSFPSARRSVFQKSLTPPTLLEMAI